MAKSILKNAPKKRIVFSLDELIEIESGLDSMMHLHQQNIESKEEVAYSKECLTACERALRKVERAKEHLFNQKDKA